MDEATSVNKVVEVDINHKNVLFQELVSIASARGVGQAIADLIAADVYDYVLQKSFIIGEVK